MEDFSEKISVASLVILHAGAGSVIHAVRAGKIPVVMPRRVEFGEHVDNHQVEFAMELEKFGKVIVAMEPTDLEGAISRALTRQATTRRQELRPPLVALIRERLDAYAEERA
jgi:UDP-N-acetylglucosamine transferase subunit ALG13